MVWEEVVFWFGGEDCVERGSRDSMTYRRQMNFLKLLVALNVIFKSVKASPLCMVGTVLRANRTVGRDAVLNTLSYVV